MQATGQSDSRKLYEFICGSGLEFGRTISKDDLTTVLGKPFDRYRSALYTAVRWLERENQRTLICIPRKGYRIAHPKESEDIATLRIKRSSRQIAKGRHTVENTDVSVLTQEERRRLDAMQAGLNAVQQELKRVKRRLTAAEGRLEAIEEGPKLNADEVEFLRRLMQRGQ